MFSVVLQSVLIAEASAWPASYPHVLKFGLMGLFLFTAVKWYLKPAYSTISVSK
jgi:hypothetical protein